MRMSQTTTTSTTSPMTTTNKPSQITSLSLSTVQSTSTSCSLSSTTSSTIKNEQSTNISTGLRQNIVTSNTDRSTSPKMISTPTSLSEWQLLAVLNRANLIQYYDTFISQGGDDINQIMQCDEQEFLEIMSLVGMLSKPLHVRRLQKALSEYSQDQTAFNLSAINLIGPPPPSNYSLNGADPMSILLPGMFGSLSSASSSDAVDTSSTSPAPNTPSVVSNNNSVSLAIELSSSLLEPIVNDQRFITTTATSNQIPILSKSADHIGTSRATANIVPGQNIGHHFGSSKINLNSQQSTTQYRCGSSGLFQEKEGSSSPFLAPLNNDFVSLGDFDPNYPSLTENPVLSAAQVNRLTECAVITSKSLPPLPPRLVQNKKRVSKEVLELMSSGPLTPNRVALYRKFSAIYGRFDTKRKPHKVLTLHETAVNEAAAQLCLRVPALLTRRDELFPLARQIVKDAGYHYAKTRKRPCDPADLHSPISSPSTSPPPGLAEQGFEAEKNEQNDEVPSSSSGGGEMKVKEEQNVEYSSEMSVLDQWANGFISQQKKRGTGQ